MKKRIFMVLAAMVAISLGIVGMSAFEAHVINVTATIENALSVPTEAINFGTVFPQEKLDKTVEIGLSSSFLREEGALGVNYMIRQKPKCGITNANGTVLVGPTATGHVVVGDDPNTEEVETYWIDCGTSPRVLATDETWGVLPSLCQYLSKHEIEGDQATVDVPAFHQPFKVDDKNVIYTEAKGALLKTDDTADIWNLDLKVPCFGGQCAQDWEEFVHEANAEANASEFVQPKENEHKVFGCDLWFETTGITRTAN